MRRFVVTGGGTGGHLVIARALLQAILKAGDEAIFIGSQSGQDRQWFEADSGFAAVHFLHSTGVVNRRGPAKLAALWRTLRAAMQARRIIKACGAEAVISVGGFSAAPASFAALSLGLPYFIHEQNAVSGRLNRLLRPFARAFFSSYDPRSPVRAYPVDAPLFAQARIREQVGTVIFLGGSQGARAINDFALRVAPILQNRGITIIHQCGAKDFDRIHAAYEEAGIRVELYGFTKELPHLIARADLAVSRAGASTLWELCASALPALYVPYPYAAGDHQYHNAKFLADAKASWVVRESALDETALLVCLDGALAERSRTLQRLAEPGGAEAILHTIKERC